MLFMVAVSTIVMLGLLVLRVFKNGFKKQIIFILFIYFLLLIRVVIIVNVLYLLRPSHDWIFLNDILLIVFSSIFSYINRKKIDSKLFYIFFTCLILFIGFVILYQVMPNIIIFYYIYIVLFVSCNTFFYLLILSFLINSRDDN
jgi:hypothetical protein